MTVPIALVRRLGEISEWGMMAARDALVRQNGDPHRALADLAVRGQAVVRPPEVWERIIAAKAEEYRTLYPDLAAEDETAEPSGPGP